MSWFYSFKKYSSPKNGTILVTRRLGAWCVEVGGTYQTSSYTNEMWADTMQRITDAKPKLEAHKALLIGLGGGGAIRAIGKKFPAAEVTAIEHDPVMADIAKEIGLYKPFPFPRVIIGDAAEAVPALTDTYELAIVDIFNGRALAPITSDAAFWDTLKTRLSAGGVVAVNVSGHRDALKHMAPHFPDGTIWNFRRSTLGAFW